MIVTRIVHFAFVSLTVNFTLLPYIVPKLTYSVDPVLLELWCAGLWIVSFVLSAASVKRGGWRRWWLLITAPFALLPAARTLLIFLIWKTNGFAP